MAGESHLTVESVIPDFVKVRESDFHRRDVVHPFIFESMFLEQRFNARGNERLPKLRHRWKQMVFYLEVQVAHPPIDNFERSRLNIHRVVRGETNPVDLQAPSDD